MFKLVFSLVITASLLALVNCQSKTAETSPSKVQNEEVSLDERSNQKKKADSHIEKVLLEVEKIKRVLNIVERIKEKSDITLRYNLLDFLIDINQELQKALPDAEGLTSKFQKRTIKLNLPKELKDKSSCQDYNIFLTVEELNDTVQLNYSMSGCDENFNEMPIFVVNLNKGLSFNIFNKNLNSIFQFFLLDLAQNNSSCKIQTFKDVLQEQLQCKNIPLELSDSKNMIIKNINYNNFDNLRVDLFLELFEGKELLNKQSVKIYSNGETKVEQL